MSTRNCHLWAVAAPVTLALLISASCSKPAPPKTAAVTASQKTFASPEEAGAALIAAAASNDRNNMAVIFGPGNETVLFAGDTAKDQAALQEFAKAYGQMHRWGKIRAGAEVLYVGADNYAFPIPLGQNESGQWLFDTAAGKDEIQARRIGRGELRAMEAAAAIANAERKYFQQVHDSGKGKQYALKFVSDPGKRNGLFWTDIAGQPASPLSGLGDFSGAVGSTAADQPVLFNGYYYRILGKGDAAKGFAILAYPAEYRNSGIMSFAIGQDGKLYQKDLGEKTVEVAATVADFNPTDGWDSTANRTGTASRTQ